MTKHEPLDVDSLNSNLLKAEYAVRGAIAVKSQEYVKALSDGVHLPFKKVLQCNIGTRKHHVSTMAIFHNSGEQGFCPFEITYC